MSLNWSKDRARRQSARARHEQYETDRATDRAADVAVDGEIAKEGLEALIKTKFHDSPKTTLRCPCGHVATIPAVSGLRFRCSQCQMRFVT